MLLMAEDGQDQSTGRGAANGSGTGERIRAWFIALVGYWVLRLVGITLRWQVEGWDNHQSIHAAGKRVIYTFWHGRIFMATYFFRDRGIVVMTSQNRDGEYIARVIRRFGYGAARGSSSRGAKGALVEMVRELRGKKDVAFTIDGPRGPRYVAKPGAVWIASKTGDGILPFHMSPEKSWVFKSWDHFHFPKPFSRVLAILGTPIYVKQNPAEEDLTAAQEALQQSLEEMLHRGDIYWQKGTTRATRTTGS
jgi:lysophospholipid acyltransferase (LPLAT)-like uncharacterized protein